MAGTVTGAAGSAVVERLVQSGRGADQGQVGECRGKVAERLLGIEAMIRGLDSQDGSQAGTAENASPRGGAAV